MEKQDVVVVEKKSTFWTVIKILLIVAVVCFVAAKIYAGSLKKQLNTVRQQEAASGYVRANSLNVSCTQDLFLYRSASRSEKQSSESSSSHTSSSGASHGGGGGKF